MARMTLTVRVVATSLALGFCLYFIARGMWWIEQPDVPPLMLAALALYLGIMVMITLTDDAPPGRMPLWTAITALVAAATIPTLVSLSLHSLLRSSPFATWYVGAVGLVAVVCVVRGRPFVGWAAFVLLAVAAMFWMGPSDALRLGLVGSLVWMVVAQLLVLMWARAMRDTERLTEIQQQVFSWRATQQVRQRERRQRVQYALAVAGPVLTRVVATGGVLDDAERRQARLAEGRLRDELRGGGLLNDAVRAAIAEARLAGATVTVLDEGGLDGLPEQRQAEIRDELAEALQGVGGMRVIVRAARHAVTAVTVVGRWPDGEHSDEDAVGLWRAIPRVAESEEPELSVSDAAPGWLTAPRRDG